MVAINKDSLYEWEFKVPSSEVDLVRIVQQLGSLSTVTQLSYMGNLKSKAPIVYERLRQYCKQSNTLTWWRFDVDHN